MTARLPKTLALAFALATTLVAPAAAQFTIDPGPIIGPLPQPIPTVPPCSEIASISPTSARAGEDVDIFIRPPSGLRYPGASVVGVTFAGNVSATFTNVAADHVRAKVPVGAGAGPIQVTCRSSLTGGTWNISSPPFTPINFGTTLNPSSTTLLVGNSTNVTATLSHPAPSPITLTLTPQNVLSVLNNTPGAPGTVVIPAGARSASFSVRAHGPAAAATVTVTGPSVSTATLTVNVPTPSFSLSVPDDDAEVHWGDSASYAVELTGTNNFSGNVTLTATSLPFGASAAPVTVNVPMNGTATATFAVATNQSATALGTDSFTLRATAGATTRTRTLDLRVLPDEGAFSSLTWRTTDSNCNGVEADVTGTNITFDGPTFPRTQAHTLLRYAWTPDCRGAVVMGTSTSPNGGWPMSIFNFGFDNAIADGPGSRYNLGLAAWAHTHFKASPDGSFVIGATLSGTYNASLYDMLSLSKRGATDSYSIAETLAASIVGDEVQARPSGNSNDWDWTLP